jgi:hypothetical protein
MISIAMCKHFISLTILLLLCGSVFPQSKIPHLEKIISVRINNLKTDAALNVIAEQGGFLFSYNPSLIDLNRTVNYTFSSRTVREIIQILFNGKLEGKARGNHVILIKTKLPPAASRKDDIFKVSGYIKTAAGERVPWVSLYNKYSMSSAVSDEFGFYTIELPKELTNLSINISKKEFNDTTIQLPDNNSRFLNIELNPVLKDTAPDVDIDRLYRDAEETSGAFYMTHEGTANKENIKDTLYRHTQISFIPFAGTNGRLSGNVINDYSINVIGGYSLGTQKMELAGFFNVNRGDAGKFQAAGFVNAAGGNVNGLQGAGFVNAVAKNVKGCQLAGFVNGVGGDVSSFQAAGFVNAVAGNVSGVQMAGFVNTVRKNVDGLQMAGFVNFVWGNSKGAQAAGFVNATRGKNQGAQVAGFVNAVLDTAGGAQVAGFINYAHRQFTGTQVAGFVNASMQDMKGSQTGFLNYAKRLNGAQVGVLNFSESCTGVPVGFLSYVHSGYHKIEVSADEIFYINAAFRTGVAAFHNIITAGIRPSIYNNPLWTFGYGIGSTAVLSKRFNIDFDIISNQVVIGGRMDRINLINKGYAGLEFKLADKFSIAAGPTINAQITDNGYLYYPQIFRDIQPDIFYSTSLDGERLFLKMWIGGKIALRLL